MSTADVELVITVNTAQFERAAEDAVRRVGRGTPMPYSRAAKRPRPVRVEELTEAMLAPVRRAAVESWLPQTVWPSEHFGPRYEGPDCLLTSIPAVLAGGWDGRVPPDMAEGSEPLLTVIPPSYYRR